MRWNSGAVFGLLLCACTVDDAGSGGVGGTGSHYEVGIQWDVTDQDAQALWFLGPDLCGSEEWLDVEDVAGGYGAPCTEHDQCRSHWCLAGHDQGSCAAGCEEEPCGQGALCQRLTLTSADMLWVCLPDRTPFCRPCFLDQDCEMTAAVCHQIDTGHRYCTRLCDERQACPQGFGCKGGVCIALQGDCDCRQAPGSLGLYTPCTVKNQWGQCQGLAQCTESGLSACDAQPAQREVCDGLDNDCDGLVDEEHTIETCLNGNGFGYCTGDLLCLSGELVCTARTPEEEACDGFDNNCNGLIDEEGARGCRTLYPDDDGDGFGTAPATCACDFGALFAQNAQDCDDHSIHVHPGGEEGCDGVDNNCDGVVDEGCDADADGYCRAGSLLQTLVCPKLAYDCNDFNPVVHPGAPEVWNGKDDDCDGVVDEVN